MSQIESAIVVGAGMVGSAAALVLARAGIKVTLVEKYWPKALVENDEFDLRVSAISPLSQTLLQRLTAWPLLQPERVAPYRAMQVWDESNRGGFYLDAQQSGGSALGYIVENRHLQLALLQQVDRQPLIQKHTIEAIEDIDFDRQWHIKLADQSGLKADFLLAADGADSSIRKLLAIPIQGRSYAQQGLVVNVRCEKAHQNVARQRFLHTGPLAFLPLPDPHQCSIVWSCTNDLAKELMALPEAEFQLALEQGLVSQLGAVEWVSRRASFPLRWQIADHFVRSQAMLLGDAAHSVHPLAGQGVNQGFSDVLELERILQQGLNIAHASSLRRYQRRRKAEVNFAMQSFTALNWIYAQQSQGISWLRQLGMQAIDRCPPIKSELMRSAMRNLGLPTA